MIGIVLPGERKNLFILFVFLANFYITFNTHILSYTFTRKIF